ncbi:hypothetical protein DBP88_02875 [Enterobacter hormaechei]|nr:hypothetical protein DBP88_02875 [Enterobacter hormaechei]TYF51048.1 hypothetical protein DJ546_10465 [Enterobacter hormaechei]
MAFPTFDKIVQLKSLWKVSAMALIVRMRNLNVCKRKRCTIYYSTGCLNQCFLTIKMQRLQYIFKKISA